MSESSLLNEERRNAALLRDIWRTTLTSRLFVWVVRPGGRPTITLIRLRRIPTCPRWATSPSGGYHCTAPNQLRDWPWGYNRSAPGRQETGQVAPTWIPPQEGNAAPVIDAAAGPFIDGSHADTRGAVPTGYEHGANYGGYLATEFNSSMVNDDEAASRAEYRYQQQVQGHASRTQAYGDLYSCPRPNARRTSLRRSFDGRERESQSSHALERIEGIMARMEQHLAVSTLAPATSSASHSAPFNSGEFH
jgi:hypothetical protein